MSIDERRSIGTKRTGDASYGVSPNSAPGQLDCECHDEARFSIVWNMASQWHLKTVVGAD